MGHTRRAAPFASAASRRDCGRVGRAERGEDADAEEDAEEDATATGATGASASERIVAGRRAVRRVPVPAREAM